MGLVTIQFRNNEIAQVDAGSLLDLIDMGLVMVTAKDSQGRPVRAQLTKRGIDVARELDAERHDNLPTGLDNTSTPKH